MKEHWERVYQKIAFDKLGWYEARSEPSLQLIEKCNLPEDAVILTVGAGASTLVDELLNMGFTRLIANDISSRALEELQLRLGPEQSNIVQWVVDDLTHPDDLQTLKKIDLWHDRAVLHFFNEREEQDAYFNLLRNLVKPEGYVIIAAFNLDGAPKCSGLPVFRYNAAMLQTKLGNEFLLKETFDTTYTMPSGDTREYVYTLFQRKPS